MSLEQRESRKKVFEGSINLEAVYQLATRHHHRSMPCRLFRAESASGSFNICYFVEFSSDCTRWVVRIPIAPAIQAVWAKLQSEVAKMQNKYIKHKTTIPIPNIHGFGPGAVVDDRNPLGLAYLTLDFIDGQSVDISTFVHSPPQDLRNTFYSQLIDVFAQLRQLEFDVAGSLTPASASEDEPGAVVVGPLLSIGLNQLHKDDPDTVTALPSARFHSTIDFVFHHLQPLHRSNELPEEDITLQFARKIVFALHHMEGTIVRATDPCLNHGPFVLAHSDLRWSNIIVDENLNIRGIIDWEWAGAVPRQMFVPPTWLAAREATALTGDANLKEYARFHAILTRKAAESAACRLLAEEWGPDLPRSLAYPLAVALRHPMQAVDIFSSVIYPKGKQPLDEAIHRFFVEDGDNGPFALQAQRYVEESEEYKSYLEQNGLYIEPQRPSTPPGIREMRKTLEKLESEREARELGSKERRSGVAALLRHDEP